MAQASINSILKNKRVIIVQQSLEMGGAERQGLYFAEWLVNHCGASVEFWGFQSWGQAALKCEELGIKCRLVEWNWNEPLLSRIKSLIKITIELRKAKPDIILPYTMPANIACGIVWRFTGAKTCIWNQRDEGRQRFGNLWEMLAVKLTPSFISNSKHARFFLTSNLGINIKYVNIIYNGVELSPVINTREEWRHKIGVSETTIMACMIANIHAYKDHFTLIKAWSRVIQEWPGVRNFPKLVLAGRDDGYGKVLKNLIEELQIIDHVYFIGSTKDVSGLLYSCDFAIFSSIKEGLPNGVLEPMAAGLAVTGTDIPGIREALGDDMAEWLSPIKNDLLLSQKILALSKSKELRSTLGKLNKERVQRIFCIETMCSKTIKVISQNN